MADSAQKARSILFIGGCVVNGYPFLYEESFVHRACERLQSRGYRIEPVRLAPAKTSQLSRISEAIDQHSPDAVVLQLGGLETILLLEDVVRRWLGIHVPKREYNNHLHTSPFRHWRTRLRWRIMVTAKRIADTLLLHPIVNFPEYRQNLRRMIELVRDRANGPVLVMGLLPFPEPVSRYYRDRLEPMFIEECSRANVRLLNVAEAWRNEGRDSTIFHDPIHLNVRGHIWLAPLVADAIEACLGTHGTPSAQPASRGRALAASDQL